MNHQSLRPSTPEELAAWVWPQRKSLRTNMITCTCAARGGRQGILALTIFLPQGIPVLWIAEERGSDDTVRVPRAFVLDLQILGWKDTVRCRTCGRTWGIHVGLSEDLTEIEVVRVPLERAGRIILQ